ncbi:hypothetical protein C9426_13625 [Serratia sp. S1B]|nr:hypothetical protein C9426_13625 [Serratia sp. S1B]
MPFFYLQVRKNHLTLKSLDTQTTASNIAVFSSQRMVLGQFFVAEACLYQLVPQVFPGLINRLKLRHFRSDIVIHVLELLEGGISQVEQRALQEFTVASFPKGYSFVYADPHLLSDEEVRHIITMKSEKVVTAADLRQQYPK